MGGNPLLSRTAFCLLVLSSGATSSAPWKEKCWDKGAAGLYSHVMRWGDLIHCKGFVCELTQLQAQEAACVPRLFFPCSPFI